MNDDALGNVWRLVFNKTTRERIARAPASSLQRPGKTNCTSQWGNERPLNSCVSRQAKHIALLMMLAILASATTRATGAANSGVTLDEPIILEHPPRTVYYRHAPSWLTAAAQKALKMSCKKLETPDGEKPATSTNIALGRFCAGTKPVVLMAVDYRDRFNRILVACLPDLNLHYVVYPIYWADIFNDSEYCVAVFYEPDERRYKVWH